MIRIFLDPAQTAAARITEHAFHNNDMVFGGLRSYPTMRSAQREKELPFRQAKFRPDAADRFLRA